jgi:hypothetical protein
MKPGKTGGADIPVCPICLNHQISRGRQECLPHLHAQFWKNDHPVDQQIEMTNLQFAVANLQYSL